MEVAHAEVRGRELHAEGTQIGVAYELRYRLAPGSLAVAIVGGRSLELELDGADAFDLGYSPLFNSLPVLEDDLLLGGPARDYLMRWVDVPSLEVRESQQRYEPLGERRVQFGSGSFRVDLLFDEDGFVVDYPGLARRA